MQEMSPLKSGRGLDASLRTPVTSGRAASALHAPAVVAAPTAAAAAIPGAAAGLWPVGALCTHLPHHYTELIIEACPSLAPDWSNRASQAISAKRRAQVCRVVTCCAQVPGNQFGTGAAGNRCGGRHAFPLSATASFPLAAQ